MDESGLDALTERSAPLAHNNNNNPTVPSNAAAPATEDEEMIAAAHEQSSQFYPEGGYGWIVLAATFVVTF
ncbi:hypothetical protein BGW39_006806, partial [Mortierella sp. 14UC]